MRFPAYVVGPLCFSLLQFLAAGLDAQAQRVDFVTLDPHGNCNNYGTTTVTVNTTSGTVMSCNNGSWVKTGGGYGVPAVAALPDTCSPDGNSNIVFLQTPPYGVYGCTAVNSWAQVGPTIIPADAYPSLLDAVAAGNSNVEIVLPPGYVATLPSALPLGGANVTLRCEPGSMIVKGNNGNAVVVSGTNMVIDGCTIDGGGPSYIGQNLIISLGNGVIVKNSTIQNGASTGVGISASNNVVLMWDSITGNLGSAIYGQDSISGLEISGNDIDSTSISNPGGLDTIGIHTSNPGGYASNIVIHDNTIVHAGSNFAIEIGSFGIGSQPPNGVSVFNNNIRLAVPSNGAISLSSCNNGIVSNNNINAGGFPMTIDAIELASVAGMTADSNIIHNTAPGTTYTAALNGSSNNSFTNNTMEGGIYVGTSSFAMPNVNGNTIKGNTMTAPANSILSRGLVWLQCNVPSCSVSQNVITSNVLTGNASGPGINFENDYGLQGGVMDSNTASGNQITGAVVPINIGTNVNRTN